MDLLPRILCHFCKDLEWVDHLEFVARVTSHIPDKCQVTVCYYGFCANAHRGKVKNTIRQAFPHQMVEEELPPIPFFGST